MSYKQLKCVKNKMTILPCLELLINSAKTASRYYHPIVKY